ncbi:hypothetical protein SD37_35280 [Amycolatopsis orientalis]|uniref:Uncharacterized protein n=1 Tax=Amycolatopsis orientalis TaxID=31958 RepID=A0A193CCP1_AMYOR|nr:hypothetical protein [Amycolatopsis orientalis]ANN22252.1 hypothetical protein SD37_35280 [Amycolatopsis orientalis]
MARKFGRRGKPAAGVGPEVDPRDLFGTPQPARQAARPASSTPLADHLNRGWPGVDPGYVVLPRSLAEGMSLPWQQQMAALLAQFHHENAQLAWPIYRVVPSRYEKLVDLDEEQLAEAGYLVEMDTEGEMIYRERSGRKIEDPANTTVLVSCLDPIPKPAQRQAPPPSQAAPPAAGQPPRAPAPMNIGPAPVWRTVTPPAAPPLPGPAASQAPPPAQPQAGPPVLPQTTAAPPPAVLQTPPPAVTPPPVQPPAAQAPPPAVSAPPATPEAQSATPSQAEPQPEPPPAAPPPVAPPVTGPPPAPLPQPASPASPPEPATPPRGVPVHRGWFDELAENPPESSKLDPPEGGEFGPTGEPTEIPYRYRK